MKKKAAKTVDADGWSKEVTAYAYNKNGDVKKTVYTYEGSGNYSEKITSTYTYDRSGKLVKVVAKRSGLGGAWTIKTTYDYDAACRKIKEKYRNAKMATLPQWWVTAGEVLPPDTFEVWNGLGHAGEGESSIAYYLYPQWNQPEYAKGFVPDRLPDYVDVKWDFSELTSTGATGDPTKGTPEKGKLMADAIEEVCVKAIKQLDDQDWNYDTSNK